MNDVVRAQNGIRGSRLSTKNIRWGFRPRKAGRASLQIKTYLSTQSDPPIFVCASAGPRCYSRIGVAKKGVWDGDGEGRGWYIKVRYVKRAQMHYNCSQHGDFLATSQAGLATTPGSHLGPTTLGN